MTWRWPADLLRSEPRPVRPPEPPEGGDEPTAGLAYWDPLPTARLLAGPSGFGVATWKNRNRYNVPGPFYTGWTDTGGTGPVYAAGLVGHCPSFMEVVLVQPRTPEQVRTLLYGAAAPEPTGGYAWGGDDHWTPQAVRQWWAERHALREWFDDEESGFTEAGHHWAAWEADLATYLRGYLFWLIERRRPWSDEELPPLTARDAPSR
ncbi:hypothetical protein GCM10009639_09190 [Kitasatospora putterlickiae]|uniref:Uncharacterized protein n=1 Tax=Kitasatospora putterlickiae TaxID=221725 RepID=A0ABN1XP91_9ACTN